MLTKRRSLVLAVALCGAMVTTAMASPKTARIKKVNEPAKRAATTKPAKESNKVAKEKITLDVRGANSKECAQVLTTALSPMGVHVPMQTNKDHAARLTASVEPNTDLGQYGKAVMDAKMPKNATASPSLDLILFGKFDQASAKKATDTLQKIKGVDAHNSIAHTQKGELDVRIIGGAKVTADQIHKALQDAGIRTNFAATASS